jgi:hypothetical protein
MSLLLLKGQEGIEGLDYPWKEHLKTFVEGPRMELSVKWVLSSVSSGFLC